MANSSNSGAEELNSQYFDDGECDENDSFLRSDEDPSFEYGGVPHTSCQRNFADCSNVFKAFIGSAMIGLPFATLQAGVGFALVGVLIIAFLTDHCCLLIVKCKHKIIKQMVDKKRDEGFDRMVLKQEMDTLGRDMTFGRIGAIVLGKPGVILINTSLMVTQFGFTIGYFIFLGNTMRSIIKYFAFNSTVVNSSLTSVEPVNTGAILFNSNGTMIRQLSESLSHFLNKDFMMSITPHFLNSSVGFALFLCLPLPLLIIISFVRNLRKLAPVSVIANASITFAFAATALIIFMQMKSLPDPILWFKFSTFPIFFGQVTSAFEGIGTVIPIEGSMAENRVKYPKYMHYSIAGLALILSSFGIIGYLAYGEKTCQIVTVNLNGPIAVALQILLFIGVLFTYPLQIYPCVQIAEHLILKFRVWRMTRKLQRQRERNDDSNDDDNDSSETLIKNHDDKDAIKSIIKLKQWESNIIRIVLITFTAGIALIFRFQFAYIAALTGSIGSSLLSYIIPSIIHMRLVKNKWVRIKDSFLIVFGILGGVCGVTVTIMELIESFNGTIPAHC